MKILQLCLLLGFASISTAWAGSYKCVDTAGNISYNQHPIDNANCSYIRSANTPKSTAASTEARNAAKESIQQGALDSAAKSRLDSEVAKNTKLREDNCKSAKSNLQTYMVHRRFRGKDGNVTTITDDNRAARINEAKEAINSFCN